MLSELRKAQDAIRPPTENFRIPYHIGYEMALKHGKDNLSRLEYWEEQSRKAGTIIEQAERNIESWLANWGM